MQSEELRLQPDMPGVETGLVSGSWLGGYEFKAIMTASGCAFTGGLHMAISRGLRAAMLHGALCGLMAVSVAGFSQQNPAPDNSKTNQQDQNRDRPTADQQRENDTDRQLTKQIRQAILEDKSLSTYAHNVKIIAQDGQVTLRGPVRSKDEKRIVESKATGIAGDGKVTSELQVAPQKD
jgi:hyperosmotically inducible periplasmic protein